MARVTIIGRGKTERAAIEKRDLQIGEHVKAYLSWCEKNEFEDGTPVPTITTEEPIWIPEHLAGEHLGPHWAAIASIHT